MRPLDLSFSFEQRKYQLGEEISIEYTVTPHGLVAIREVRFDLVCFQVYTHGTYGYRAKGPNSMGSQDADSSTGTGGGGAFQSGTAGSASTSQRDATNRGFFYPKDGREKRHSTEAYVHSSVTVLKDTELQESNEVQNQVRLSIGTDEPEKAQAAIYAAKWDPITSWDFAWVLFASANVVKGRDSRRQRKVDIVYKGG